jgi:transaldolase
MRSLHDRRLSRQIFLDTADVNEIRELSALGLVDGVTTNPSIIAKEGRPFLEIVDEILTLVDGPISLEVVSTDAPGMVKEARDLAGAPASGSRSPSASPHGDP